MKDSFYFSHDYHARHDDKIIPMLIKHGTFGYGLYWMLVEKIYESGGRLPADWQTLSYDLRANPDIIEDLVTKFNLFFIEDGKIGSTSIDRRLFERSEKSKNASVSAKMRWEEIRKAKNEMVFDAPQLYVLLCKLEDEEFIKIGITETSISRRYSSKMPYKYIILAQYFSNKYIDMEIELTKILQQYIYVPKIRFGGFNECYLVDCLDILKTYNPTDVLASQSDFNATHINRNAIKERKGKEIKEKETTTTTCPQADSAPETKPTKRFQKPTVSEIVSYCLERKNSVEAQKFFDYYESKGWLVGKSPMRNWKAAVRTWEQNGLSNGGGYGASRIVGAAKPIPNKYDC